MTLKYHKNGLWIQQLTDDQYRLGLSEKGQDDVGEVMFAELSHALGDVKKGEALLNVEGAKAVTELTIPFDAVITRVHKSIEDEPNLLNKTDKDSNWIIEVSGISKKAFKALDSELIIEEKTEEEG